jgi:hypothetical protein
METLEEIKASTNRAESRSFRPVSHSLLLDNEHARAVAKFLRDDPALRSITART